MVNIFFTDWNPVTAARDSCDKYIVKIPVEVALLLSAVHWRNGYTGPVASGEPLILDAQRRPVSAVGPYIDSNVIKSSSETYKWLVKSTGNYSYAIVYGLELLEEFKKRYGKLHKTEGVLLWLREHVPDIPLGQLTTDVGLAMPDKYKDRNNPTASYKNYIMSEKYAVVSWKRSKVPDWYERFVYTDGAASNNGTSKCRAGYAVWFGEDDPRNFSDIVRENPSNQIAELLAIRKALEMVNEEQYTVVTDSQYSINCLTKWVQVWETNGWITSNGKAVKHKKIIQEAVNMLRNHKLVHVKSHMPEPDINSAEWKHWNGNRQADRAAVSKTAEVIWRAHPDSTDYAYTTDVELDTGYPLKHVRSGIVVATVNDENVTELTAADIAAAEKYLLKVG